MFANSASVSTMLRMWQQVAQLSAHINNKILHLERLQSSLYHQDSVRDNQLVSQEYCVTCQGLCASKITKLVQVNVAAKRLERVSSSLIEVLTVKCEHPPPCEPSSTV